MGRVLQRMQSAVVPRYNIGVTFLLVYLQNSQYILVIINNQPKKLDPYFFSIFFSKALNMADVYGSHEFSKLVIC